ncbi:50S ribosomal protein L15e [Acidilobus sp.]|jgi:large subunit ribosomal protein L15e|uniref:50S ribosomal protein L15e n=1 Tax=Acidilobus sp. TaxID=1872109 RepID=UPI003D02DCF8
MAYGLYHYIAEAWKRPYDGDHGKLMKERLVEWRDEPTIVRVDKPLRLDRARAIGYKAKQGFVVVRVRVRKGGQRKVRPDSGRRPKRMGVEGYTLAKSLQQVAEEKAQRAYPNLVVLGSYYLAEDGQHKWYEVIMVDPNAPTIKSDPQLKWVAVSASARGRPFRGLTAAGKKARGLLSSRGLKGTHIQKWKEKARERARKARHEASRGARLIVPHTKSDNK